MRNNKETLLLKKSEILTTKMNKRIWKEFLLKFKQAKAEFMGVSLVRTNNLQVIWMSNTP